MNDSTGLMAPIPSRKRAEYEKRMARERGLGGLVADLAEPLTFFPHPVINTAATIAENVGREGWAQGLLRSWDALMPAVRNARGVLNVFTKASKKASPSDVAFIIRKGITSPEAEEFHRDTKTFIDAAGNTIEEPPDVNAKMTPLFADELAARVVGDKQGPIVEEAAKLIHHPELFGRYPKIGQMPIEVNYTQNARGGTFYPEGKIILSVSSNPTSVMNVAMHELNHAVQQAEGLPRGTSVEHMLDRLVKATNAGKLPPPDRWGELTEAQRNELLRPLAKELYLLTEGELASRAVEERRLFNHRAREESLPTLYGTFPLRGYPNGVPQEMRVVDPFEQEDLVRIAKLLLGLPGS